MRGAAAKGDILPAFAGALLDPDMPLPDRICDAAGRQAGKRFAIYRNNVVVGLIDALAAAYPSIAALMGEENFRQVARNFIAAHPPRTALMLAYGDAFAAFLERFPPLRRSPFLADLARLERLWLESHHAADADTVDPAAIGAVPAAAAGGLRFKCHPAAALFESRWPVADLFEWRRAVPATGVDLDRSQKVALGRPGQSVMMAEAGAGDYVLFEKLLAGETLEAARQAATSCDPSIDLATALSVALRLGLFSGFSY